jgi:hypothetical protein
MDKYQHRLILTTSAKVIYSLTHYEQIDKGFFLLNLVAKLISPTNQAHIRFAKDVLSRGVDALAFRQDAVTRISRTTGNVDARTLGIFG